MHSVGDRVDEINKLVRQNRGTLECLRECINDPVRTRQLNGNLQNCDQLLILLKEIGVALAFRKLCFEAVHSILQVSVCECLSISLLVCIHQNMIYIFYRFKYYVIDVLYSLVLL